MPSESRSKGVQVAKVALVIWDAMYMGWDFPTLPMNVQASGLLSVAARSRLRTLAIRP
jgi:hypothetical protein